MVKIGACEIMIAARFWRRCAVDPSVDLAPRACEDDTSVVDLKLLRICSELRIGTSNPKPTLES